MICHPPGGSCDSHVRLVLAETHDVYGSSEIRIGFLLVRGLGSFNLQSYLTQVMRVGHLVIKSDSTLSVAVQVHH